MSARNGQRARFHRNRKRRVVRLMRLRTDGTSAGEPVEGARFTEKANSFAGQEWCPCQAFCPSASAEKEIAYRTSVV